MQKRFSKRCSVFLIFFTSILFLNIQYLYAISLSDDAVSYREKGYEAQQNGYIDAAVSWYQKAASLDSYYAAPHNDLGILFEAKGWLDRAQVEYQKAIAIDPDYEKAHTNLALLYERKGELEKAAFHWMRRFRLGKAGDPWTEEARYRLEKLGLIDKVKEVELLKDLQRKTTEREVPKPEPEKEEKVLEKRPKEHHGWTEVDLTKKKRIIKTKDAKKLKKKECKKPDLAKPSRKKVTDLDKADTRFAKIEKRLDEFEHAKTHKKPKAKVVKKVKRPKKETAWTRLGYAQKEEVIEPYPSKRSLSTQLEESLRLAEERLRKEKEKKEEQKTPSLNEKNVKNKISDPKVRDYYNKAYSFYKKGEYSRALDTIRGAKKQYPKDTSMLELEESVKNKMKEERIKDHYSEGMMRYEKEDFSGAKKEFESILNILPE